MSIEDRLTAGGAAWRESQPPVTVSPLPSVRRKPVLWLPLTAAAATVAVVLGATLLASRDDSPAPLASAVVPWKQLAPAAGDVAAPSVPLEGPSFGVMRPGPCQASDVEVTLTAKRTDESVDGRLRLALRPSAGPCVLGSGDPVVAFTGPDDGQVSPPSVFAGHAAGKTQPRLRDLILRMRAEPVVVPFTWAGVNCVVTDGLVISQLDGMQYGKYALAFVASFPTATVPVPCDQDVAREAGELTLGIPHVDGGPSGRLPGDRSGLEVSLELPSRVPLDVFSFVARLHNPTNEAVSLRPCPDYAFSVRWEEAGRDVTPSGVGRLNCENAPEAVPAGSTVAFEMQTGIDARNPQSDVTVTWGIAGPELSRATTSFSATVPSPPVTTPSNDRDPGTTTSLRADLDDDGRPDLATVNSTTGLVMVITEAGTLPALRLGPSVTLEVQGVLDLPGHDGLLVSTTSAGAREAAQTADVIRVVGDRLEQLRYSDGDREHVRLEFNNGRGDQWAGVRCTTTGIQVLRAALEASNTDNVVLREQDLTVGAGGVARGEIRVKGVPQGSTEEAVSTAARLTQTRCDGLTTGGVATGERSVTYAR